MKCVPMELLEDLAGRMPQAQARDAARGNGVSFDLDQWIRDRGLDVSGPTDWKGGRRWIFRTCPWNSDHDNSSAFILQFPNGAIAAGCLHNGCHGKDWHSLRALYDPLKGFQRQRGSEGALEGGSTDWEAPVPFHQFDLPLFPIEALPDWLRDMVVGVATATQTPVDLPAMLALAAVAASGAKKVHVRLKSDYIEPVNIFALVVLEPGARKSGVFRIIFDPLEQHDQAEVRRAMPEIARIKSALKIKEAKLKKLQERAVAAKGIEQDALGAEADVLAADLAQAVVPASPRLIADDCTPEELATMLRDQGGRIAVLSPEGDIFDLIAGRYSATGNPNLGVFLKGHAGDQLRIDRVGKAPEFVDKPALTVGLAVQPDVLLGLMEKRGFRGRGLLGRFLYSIPASLLGVRNTDPPPLPSTVRDTYHTKLRWLLELPVKDRSGNPYTRDLILDEAARSRMREYAAWIEPQLSEFGELGGMRDWAGKLYGAVARIAGILHMAVFAGEPAPWDFPISRETIEYAIRIGVYLIAHAKAAYAEMGADPAVRQAQLILRWIEQKHLPSFTKRDLHQALRGTFKRVEELDQPLSLLTSHGFVRKQEEVSTGKSGRKPSRVFDVNLIWLAQREGKTRSAGASEL